MIDSKRTMVPTLHASGQKYTPAHEPGGVKHKIEAGTQGSWTYLWGMTALRFQSLHCILLVLAGGVSISHRVQAQATLVNAPDTIYMALDTMGTAPAEAHWDVLNETDSPMTLMVTRTFGETVSPFNYPWESGAPGSYERFCWGPTCFQYGTDSSPTNDMFLLTLNPGESTNTFRGDFYPNGVVGNSTLNYCFHPVGAVLDGACHSVTYSVVATSSLSDVNRPEMSMTLHPNPARQDVMLTLSHAEHGVVKIWNLVGQVMREIPVVAGSTNERIALDDMTEGVWLVSYEVDGEIRKTQRLLIH